MKQILILVVIALLTGPLFAEEAVLIDFSLLKADVIKDERASSAAKKDVFLENRHTMMDFRNVAGASFTDTQKDVMKTSLAITNWEIMLSSSSRTIENISHTYAREAESKGYWAAEGEEDEEKKKTIVMGIRVHFPLEPISAWAHIKPPFDIPAFEPLAEYDEETMKLEQAEGSNGITGPSRFETQSGVTNKYDEGYTPAYGVIKNVGLIREVKVNAYSLNFPHGLYTILIDSDGNQRNIFMGFLNQSKVPGWQEYNWKNPQYITDVTKRILRLYPLYPVSMPFVKFGGFIISRDASMQGGDFITYFKDVTIIFDKALDRTDRDIDDELLWNIISDRETARKVWEMERFGQNQVLRYLENQKKATELPFGVTDRDDVNRENRQ
jgi:hypothetical protein